MIQWATLDLLIMKERFIVHCCLEKSRVMPLKSVSTTPRLELIATALSTKVDNKIMKELSLEVSKVYYWTEPIIVFFQNLRNLSARLPTFEVNRYQQIHDRTSIRN